MRPSVSDVEPSASPLSPQTPSASVGPEEPHQEMFPEDMLERCAPPPMTSWSDADSMSLERTQDMLDNIRKGLEAYAESVNEQHHAREDYVSL